MSLVRSFEGNSMKNALSKAKDALGSDVIIHKNELVDGVYRVYASTHEDDGTFSEKIAGLKSGFKPAAIGSLAAKPVSQLAEPRDYGARLATSAYASASQDVVPESALAQPSGSQPALPLTSIDSVSASERDTEYQDWLKNRDAAMEATSNADVAVATQPGAGPEVQVEAEFSPRVPQSPQSGVAPDIAASVREYVDSRTLIDINSLPADILEQMLIKSLDRDAKALGMTTDPNHELVDSEDDGKVAATIGMAQPESIHLSELTPEMRFLEDIKKAQSIADWTGRMVNDIQSMRDVIRRQILPRVLESGAYAELHRVLSAAEISPELINPLMGKMPPEIIDSRSDSGRVRRWLEQSLAQSVDAMPSPEVWYGGRTVMPVVGSSGSGKTSVIAKLAARYALEMEAASVAIISTDPQNHDQLRMHADLLGVDFVVVEAYNSLSKTLNALHNKYFILVDTPSIGHRDPGFQAHLSSLRVSGVAIEAMLVLNASQGADSLDAMTSAYRAAAENAGVIMTECVVTKLDEASKIGGVISVIARHGLRLAYQSNGRDLMNNFTRGDASDLVIQALDAASDNAAYQAQSHKDEHGARFDSLRAKVLANINEATQMLGTVRHEMRNAGYVETTRVVAQPSPDSFRAYPEAVVHQSRIDRSAGRTPNVLWSIDDSVIKGLPLFGGAGRPSEPGSMRLIGVGDSDGRNLRLS